MVAEKLNVRELRRLQGMNQSEFWSRVGVIQSSGSRYESGGNIPKAVLALIRLQYVEQIDVDKISGVDFQVIEYLKKEEPELFNSLKNRQRKGERVFERLNGS